MFSPNSRYRDNEDASLVDKDGETHIYRRRRLLPRVEDHQIIHSITRGPEERIDQMAARTLGDGTQFWQLCDANGVLNPNELTAAPRTRVQVPIPLFKVSR